MAGPYNPSNRENRSGLVSKDPWSGWPPAVFSVVSIVVILSVIPTFEVAVLISALVELLLL
jgi:hypothetical protein